MNGPFDTNKINKAVVNLTDELDIKSGSNGEMDLYLLMRSYLNNSDVRKKINKVLSDNHCV
ncbi:hypothetical protein [Aestuariibaculum marinum]|uniref:Uncharacterized protein n=1 Tax=Aestuariibaculum marinum TaxID=2683592 RepID=A0A8J6Q0L7_9FLAO|nr:hypothetical protein [Aestuariibaculum marinum]MBD0822648.1 hypothetical protein [Aestuariibaculum marinum]